MVGENTSQGGRGQITKGLLNLHFGLNDKRNTVMSEAGDAKSSCALSVWNIILPVP